MKKTVSSGVEMNLCVVDQKEQVVRCGFLTCVIRSCACSGRMPFTSVQMGLSSLLPLSWSGEGGAMIGGVVRFSTVVMALHSFISSSRSSIRPL